MRTRLALAVALAAALAAAPGARAQELQLTTVKLDKASDKTEPRIAVGPDDRRWVVTNGPDGAQVYGSRDGGLTFQRTRTDPQQREATIDTDIVAMHTGRLLASELDEAGLNFPSSYSDDGGGTWTETTGSTELADQDRQWFAVGPDDPTTHKPTVYLLYHNLGSGEVSHNMYVAKSTDGGETFGPPVPTTLPGDTAYADLQCADSGGPSSITVNPQGRIYVVFTTRASNVGGNDLGGCAATPLEFNIVNATRVWVATSPDGSPGSWQKSLAVDDSGTGQVVSMQLAYGALDNQGGFYVAYPESPKPYPDLGGAALKVVYQKPDAQGALADGKWSRPVVLTPASPSGDLGVTLVHILAGDPGKIVVADYEAQHLAQAGDTPVWYPHLVQSLDLLSAQPHVLDQQVAEIPAYRWTASEMMGICGAPTPVQGVENGTRCPRSTDVWGIALDGSCRVSVAYVGGEGGQRDRHRQAAAERVAARLDRRAAGREPGDVRDDADRRARPVLLARGRARRVAWRAVPGGVGIAGRGLRRPPGAGLPVHAPGPRDAPRRAAVGPVVRPCVPQPALEAHAADDQRGDRKAPLGGALQVPAR